MIVIVATRATTTVTLNRLPSRSAVFSDPLEILSNLSKSIMIIYERFHYISNITYRYSKVIPIIYLPSLLVKFTNTVCRELTSLILMIGGSKFLLLNIDLSGFFVAPSAALIPGFPLGATLSFALIPNFPLLAILRFILILPLISSVIVDRIAEMYYM